MSGLVLLAREPARFDRASRSALAAALALSALAAGACVDEVVVGTQPGPVSALDAGHDTGDAASQPGPDAGGEPDARPPPETDAALDAAPPPQDTGTPDSGPPPLDAAADDGGPIVIILLGEAGTDGENASDAGRLGPCSCNATLSTPDALIDTCQGEKVCWENPDDTCSVQCPPTHPCEESTDCASDEYCDFAKSDCGDSSRGWCAPRPLGDCSEIGNPVCGCDGVTYEKGCYALQAGVDFAGLASHPRCAQSP